MRSEPGPTTPLPTPRWAGAGLRLPPPPSHPHLARPGRTERLERGQAQPDVRLHGHPPRLHAVDGDDLALGQHALNAGAADVADAGQVEAAAARLEEAFGPIDVWVNNAMATVFARFLDTTPDEFARATDVTTQASAPSVSRQQS